MKSTRWGALGRAVAFGAIASAVAVGLGALMYPSSRGFAMAVFLLGWLVAAAWAYQRTRKP